MELYDIANIKKTMAIPLQNEIAVIVIEDTL
jgi:hypothetical protein